METESIYADNPLIKGQAHIRLLKILPGPPTDPIKCLFDIFDIKATPRYGALSYERSPETHSQLIYVNGQPTRVRINLWNFLSKLRSRGYHDYLWCDAICIDQSNDYERSHQVRLMSQIYRTAETVLVWLGEEQHNSSHVLRTIRSISICTDRASRAAYLTGRATLWKALADLSKQRYWSRIWIVQEITVARSIEVYCGSEKIAWPLLTTACKFPPDQVTSCASDLRTPLDGGGHEHQVMRRAAGRELNHSTMYRIIRSQRRWPRFVDSFETLYELYKESGCQDDRDRIFALLAIAKEVVLNHNLTADYNADMEETFISVVAWAGRGAVKIHSRIQFARLAANAMNLKWPRYSLESTIEIESQRSPSFSKWKQQGLPIAIRCRSLGRWTFHRQSKIATARILPEAFKSEPVEVSLPMSHVKGFMDLEFDLFGFNSSNVVLACKPTEHGTWTVAARAFYRFDDRAKVHETRIIAAGAFYQFDDRAKVHETSTVAARVFNQVDDRTKVHETRTVAAGAFYQFADRAKVDETWAVTVRAFYLFDNRDKDIVCQRIRQKFVSSVFKGLYVATDAIYRYSIELKNVAQFMEVFLDQINPKVWRQPRNLPGRYLVEDPLQKSPRTKIKN